MCVLQLECWHESAQSIELVIFPQTWKRLLSQMQESDWELNVGEIIHVYGRLETGRGRGFNNRDSAETNPDAQVIVEALHYDFEIFVKEEDPTAAIGSENFQHNPALGTNAERQLQVKMQLIENAQQNELRLRKAIEILRSYEGQDTFSIQLHWGGEKQDLQFAPAQTRVCEDLISELSQYVGRGNLVVRES
jgi:hypothetical protein